MAGKRRTCRASGRKAPGIMRSSFLPGSGRDADAQGGGRTSLMTGAACVSKERVPASLRIRLSEALAKAGRRFFFPKAPEIRAPIRRQRPAGFPFRLLKLSGSRKRRKREDRSSATAQAIVPGVWQSSSRVAGRALPDRPEKRRRAGLVEIWLYKFCALWYT